MKGSVCFVLLILIQASSSSPTVIGIIGHNVTLPCGYDARTHGVRGFCWGHGEVPISKCSNTVISSHDGVKFRRQSSRYQLPGRPTDGELSLTILNAQRSDAGVYGCRVELPKWFNDIKVNTHLIMVEELSAFPRTTVETSDPSVAPSHRTKPKEFFKAFLRAENIVRMLAIFFITITLAFILWRMSTPQKALRCPGVSPEINI